MSRQQPPPGHKRVHDWLGLRVRVSRNCTNGWGTIPAGFLATVTGMRPGHLTIKSDQCQCCGLRMMMDVSFSDLTVVDSPAPVPLDLFSKDAQP